MLCIMCRYHFLEIIFLYMYCVFYIYMRKIVGTQGQEIMEYVYMGPFCFYVQNITMSTLVCLSNIIRSVSLRLQLYIRSYTHIYTLLINLFICGEGDCKVGQIGSCGWCKNLWLRASLFISHVPSALLHCLISVSTSLQFQSHKFSNFILKVFNF